MKPLVGMLFLFVALSTLLACKEEQNFIELPGFVVGISVSDTITFGSPTAIKIDYYTFNCHYRYDRTKTVQVEYSIFIEIITKGEEFPDGGCPGTSFLQTVEYNFSPSKRGSYQFRFNSGGLVKNILVL